MYTVLVTGVGAIIGYGLARSLRASQYPVRIIGMDIYPDAVGQHWCDVFEQAVPAADPGYPEFLRTVIRTHAIDLVIPGIEQDVARMSQEAQSNAFGDLSVSFALNNPELIAAASDKWVMHGELTGAGFETIGTHISGDFAELASIYGLPLLSKPRRSYASKGIQQISNHADFLYWRAKLGDNFMVQEVVGTVDTEYTVGAFGLGNGQCSQQIVFQRMLSREGATAKARVRSIPELETLVGRMVEVFRPIGPTNLQFRFHRGRYLLLEINPRVSSSSSLRTAFGYNEAEMCIEYYLEGKTPRRREICGGSAVRYIDDMVFYDCPDS